MLNRIKHFANALILGAGAGISFGTAIIGSLAAFVELSSATSGKKKTVSGELTVKDVPETTEKEETENAGEEE